VKFYGEKQYRFALPWLFHLDDLSKLPLDIIHTQSPFPVGAAGYKLATRKHIPRVYTHHTRYQEYNHYLHLPERLLRWVTRTSMGRVVSFMNGHSAVIAPSRGVQRELEELGVTKPITVIPTGIDVAQTIKLAEASDPDVFLGKFGIKPNDRFLIFTSRIGKEKNIPFLLNAFCGIARRDRDVKFVIAGDGTERPAMEKLAAKLGISSRTAFTGFLTHDNLFPMYRRAEAFLFSSFTETQGLAVAEAMAVGLPVVALRAMGIEDVLDNDEGGFLVDGSSQEAFIKKIELLLNNQDVRKQKSAEARRRAAIFSSRAMAERLLHLYQDVIASKGNEPQR
jgi:glycosyltransferase involved in cell wall biosynthesis